MTIPPLCPSMGSHCQALRVTLRVGTFEDGLTSLDHEATWLTGHTQRMTFGQIWDDGGDLYVDAVIRVPCRYLREKPEGASCGMYGYSSQLRRTPVSEQPRRLGGNRFRVVEGAQLTSRELPPPLRSLPVIAFANPCATAACETSDHKRGAACCRDLEIEIMCTEKQIRLESLVRTRKSPYLCKVERGGKYSLEAELISACDFLGVDGIACTLHGRKRADGRPAKPDLCSEWPHKGKGLHPGCVFKGGKAPMKAPKGR
ncbi:MAG: hypothetical protein ABI679_06945 [Gemmatimonadota bacterium]